MDAERARAFLLTLPHRIFWVAAERWSALRDAEWKDELRAAHEITLGKLPQRVRDVLAMPRKAREKLIRERRVVLAAKAAKEQAAKAASKRAAKA